MDTNTKIDLVLGELKNICAQIDERFDKVEARLDKIEERLDKVEARLDKNDETFEKFDRKLDGLSLEVGSLHRTFFKMDVNSQEKFKTLFEANQLHTDKELIFEKQLYRQNDILDNTTFRVSILEDNLVRT